MRFQFAGFGLDTSREELRRGEERIALEPRALRLLALLLEARGDAVSKQALLHALWPDVAVAEGSLTRLVHLARAALSDRDREHPIIRTLYGRGYQVAVPISVDEADTTPHLHRRPGSPCSRSTTWTKGRTGSRLLSSRTSPRSSRAATASR